MLVGVSGGLLASHYIQDLGMGVRWEAGDFIALYGVGDPAGMDWQMGSMEPRDKVY